MADTPEKDVNQETEVNPSPSVPTEQDTSVNDQPETTVSTEDPATQEQGQEQVDIPAKPAQVPSVEVVDDHGVPWKNRAIEATRRLQETQDIVKQTVQEALQGQQKKEQYTKEHIPQLRQYAQDHPEFTQWVDDQIAEIRAREVVSSVEQKLEARDRSSRDESTRRQAETWIISDPVFKRCFVDTPTGKVWNQADPLAQHMIQILNSPDPITGKLVKDRPDAFYVAADMAYGRFARMNMQKSTTQVQKLKKDLAKSQKINTIPGTGKPAPASSPKSPVKGALENYSKTYARKDIQEATKQHLVGLGILSEE